MSRCSSLLDEAFSRRRETSWAEQDLILERLVEEFAEQNRLLEEACHGYLQDDLADLEGGNFTRGLASPQATALRIEVRDWDVGAKDAAEAVALSDAASALDEESVQSELDTCQRLRRELQTAEEAATSPPTPQLHYSSAMREELEELQADLSSTRFRHEESERAHEAERLRLLGHVQRLQRECGAFQGQALRQYVHSLSHRAIAASSNSKEQSASAKLAGPGLEDSVLQAAATASGWEVLQSEHLRAQEECCRLEAVVSELTIQQEAAHDAGLRRYVQRLSLRVLGSRLHRESSAGSAASDRSAHAAGPKDLEGPPTAQLGSATAEAPGHEQGSGPEAPEALSAEHMAAEEKCHRLEGMVGELRAENKNITDMGLQNYVRRLCTRALAAGLPEEPTESNAAAEVPAGAWAVSEELAELREAHSSQLQRQGLASTETAEKQRRLQEEIEGLQTECRQLQDKALQPYVRGLSYRVLALLDRQELRHSAPLDEPRPGLSHAEIQHPTQDDRQWERDFAEQRETQLLHELESLRMECGRAEEKAQQMRRRSTARAESADEAWEEVTKLQGKLERARRRHANEQAALEAGAEHLKEEVCYWESRAVEAQEATHAEATRRREADVQQEKVEHLDTPAAQRVSDAFLVEVLPKRKETSCEEELTMLTEQLEALRQEHLAELERAHGDHAEVEEALSSASAAQEQAMKLEGRLDKWKRRHADEVDRREAAEDLAATAEAEVRLQLQEARHLRGSMLEQEEVSQRLSLQLETQAQSQDEEPAAGPRELPEVAALREEVSRCRRSCEEGAEEAEGLERQLRILREACGEEAEEVVAADEQATKLELRAERWRRRHSAEVEKREVAVEDLEKAEDALARFVEEAKETDIEGILASEWRKAHEREVERGELAAVEAADAAEHQLLDLRAGIEAWKRTYELESEDREEVLKEELEALQGWREDAPEDGQHSCKALVECRWRCLAEVLLCDEYAEAANLGAQRASALAACRWEHLAGQLLMAELSEAAERSKWQAAALAVVRWCRLVDQLLRGQQEEALFVQLKELSRAHVSIEALRSELEAASAQETPSFCGPEALPWESADSASLSGQEVEQLIAAREQAFVLVGQLQDQCQKGQSELEDSLQLCAEESIEVRDLEASQLLLHQENLDYRHALEASQREAGAEAEELRQVLEELRCAQGQTLQSGHVPGIAAGSETDITTPRGAEISSGGEACSVRSASYPPSATLRAGPRARLAHRKEAREARAAQAASGQRTPPG